MLDKTGLINDIDALRQHTSTDADAGWVAFRDGLANAIEKYVKSGEYNYAPGAGGTLISSNAGTPVGGTFKVKLT